HASVLALLRSLRPATYRRDLGRVVRKFPFDRIRWIDKRSIFHPERTGRHVLRKETEHPEMASHLRTREEPKDRSLSLGWDYETERTVRRATNPSLLYFGELPAAVPHCRYRWLVFYKG